MNKYYKNSILCGDIDFHCLLCEETFHYAADMDRHVRWESHRKKVKANTYMEKFKGDYILKIGDLYYCEVCNVVLPTSLKTTLHINNEKHVTNKENPTETKPQSTVTRDAGTIKISNNIIINEMDWNGIVDDQCIICDKDFDDVESHITETKHVISLIQSEVVLQNSERAYRKIDGDIRYSFLCKVPFPTSTSEKHWASKEHSEKTKTNGAKIVNNGASTSGMFSTEFKNNMKKMFAFSEPNNKTKNENASTKTLNAKTGSPEILSHLQEFKKGGIEIDLEKSSAVCKVCKFAPAFTVQAISGHIKMHKKAENDSPGFTLPAASNGNSNSNGTNNGNSNGHVPDSASDDEDWSTEDESEYDSNLDDIDDILANAIVPEEPPELNNFTGSVNDFVKMKAELKKYGKLHHMELVAEGTKGYCSLCDTHVSAHIKNFHQHVTGGRHSVNAKIKAIKDHKRKTADKEFKTKSLRDYLRNIFFVKQMDDFWVNRTFCIDKHSFFIVCHQKKNDGKEQKMKCFICDEVFPADKDQAHCQRTEHRNKMFATKVVISMKREFVREIRPNMYHCGFCNEVTMSWDLMKLHLNTNGHKDFREQQKLVADMTDDMYGMHMEDTNSAETDIMWMQLMGNRLF